MTPTAPARSQLMTRAAPFRLLDSLATFAMFAVLGLVTALLLAACSSRRTEAAPERSSASERAMSRPDLTAPSLSVAPIAADRLCVTKGAAALGTTITEPAVRAIALGSSGDAASLSFVFRGDTALSRELASGESRRQLGLKLRAQDGCNLLYIMWRLDPKPSLSVSLKLNPGMRTHRECGATGYTRLKPARSPSAPASLSPIPALSPGSSHTLRAEIVHDDLLAWIDDDLVWRGPLPPAARTLSGPAGLRSDNIRFDLVSFSAAATPSSTSSPATSSSTKCTAEPGD
jgi:hypothetical protein